MENCKLNDAYDALGRRIWKNDPAAATPNAYYYYNDQWQILCEFDGSVFGNSYVYGNTIDESLLMNDGENDYYYVHDHLYSPAALTDESGTVVERYEYDAYGKVHFLTSDFGLLTSSQVGNPFTFTGRQLDVLDGGALHHMHYRHRDYSPTMGRFFQQDPLGVSISTVFREFESPWIIGQTGPTGGGYKYSRLLKNYLTIAHSKNLSLFLQGITKDESGHYSKYPQYVNGMSLYQLAMSQPLIYTDPYGLTIKIDDIFVWNPDAVYSEKECNAYCAAQAAGLTGLPPDLVGEARDAIIDEIISDGLGAAKACGNMNSLGICNTNCMGGIHPDWNPGDPWPGAGGSFSRDFIVIWCILLACLNLYVREKRRNAKN